MKYTLQRSLFILLIFIWGITGHSYGQNGISRPNIIFIIADDVGWNDLGCYGNEVIKTPEIDKLAANGLKFNNAFLTASSCSPSRCSIITGRWPHNTGAPELHMPLPAAQIPFPLLLKEAGYYTVQAGKTHMGPDALRAFDIAYAGKDAGTGGEERWVKCLQERPKDKPFFAWFASFDAHRPWQADDFQTPQDPDLVKVPPFLANAPGTRRDISSYYNEIRRLDNFIGRVVEELRRQDILDNTLIMFVSDNGRPFPGCKTRVYDRGMKTPMIIQWPGHIKEGIITNSLVSVIDIAPTLLEVAGVNTVPQILGQSFTDLFIHPDKEFRHYVFAEHNWHDYEAYERMVRTKYFLFIINERPSLDLRGPADSNSSPSFTDLKDLRDQGLLTPIQADAFMAPRPHIELYDCVKDPEQFVNVASLPEYREVARDLEQVLKSWMSVTKDNVPVHLTGDCFDRETGKQLKNVEQERGETPGVASGALQVNKSDIQGDSSGMDP